MNINFLSDAITDCQQFKLGVMLISLISVAGCSSGPAEHQGINASVASQSEMEAAKKAQATQKLESLEGHESPTGEVTELPGFTKNQDIQDADPITADEIEKMVCFQFGIAILPA